VWYDETHNTTNYNGYVSVSERDGGGGPVPGTVTGERNRTYRSGYGN